MAMGAAGIVVGDVMVSINGQTTVGIDQGALVAIIQASGQPDGSKSLNIVLVPASGGAAAPAPEVKVVPAEEAPEQPPTGIITAKIAQGEKLGIDFECTAAGVALSSVAAGSALANAGLKAGDVITQINKRSTVGITQETLVSYIGAASFPDGSKELHIALLAVTVVTVPSGAKLGIDFECTPAGVILSSVAPDSALHKSGIRSGDGIVVLNGNNVMGLDQNSFVQLVGASGQPDGSKVMHLGMARTARASVPDGVKLGIDFECTANGVVLESVAADSPLAAAGLAPGCTLQSLNGQSLIPADQAKLVGLIQSAPTSGEGVAKAKSLVFTYSQVVAGATAGGSASGAGRGWGRKKKAAPIQAGEGAEGAEGAAESSEPSDPLAMKDPNNQKLKVVLEKSKDFKLGIRYECHHDGVHVKEVEVDSACFSAEVQIGHCIVAIHADNRRLNVEDADTLSLEALFESIPEDADASGIKTVELEVNKVQHEGHTADGFFSGNPDELEIRVPDNVQPGEKFECKVGNMVLDVYVPTGANGTRCETIHIVPATCFAYAVEHMQRYTVDTVDGRTRGNVSLHPKDLILENPVFQEDGFAIEEPGTDGSWKCNECAQRIPVFTDEGGSMDNTYARTTTERDLRLDLSIKLQHKVCEFLVEREPKDKVKKSMLSKLKTIDKIKKEVKKFVKYLLFFEQFDDKTSVESKDEALKNKEEALQIFVEGDVEEHKVMLNEILDHIREEKDADAKDELLNILFERMSKSSSHDLQQKIAPNFAVKKVLRQRENDIMEHTLDLQNCCYECIEGCAYRICGHCYLMAHGQPALWTEKTPYHSLPLVVKIQYYVIRFLGLDLRPTDFLECDRIMMASDPRALSAQELNRRRFRRAMFQGLTSLAEYHQINPVSSKKILDYKHALARKPVKEAAILPDCGGGAKVKKMQKRMKKTRALMEEVAKEEETLVELVKTQENFSGLSTAYEQKKMLKRTTTRRKSVSTPASRREHDATLLDEAD
jgi:S1-C subfamily serine protease